MGWGCLRRHSKRVVLHFPSGLMCFQENPSELSGRTAFEFTGGIQGRTPVNLGFGMSEPFPEGSTMDLITKDPGGAG